MARFTYAATLLKQNNRILIATSGSLLGKLHTQTLALNRKTSPALCLSTVQHWWNTDSKP